MNADLTLFQCLYGSNGPGIPTGRGEDGRKENGAKRLN